ncbi:MAG: 4'-phosphopantetheinyl transferase superfamily protein [Bacteroidia bacterium]|nr:MAG: 4'-phosphopantetheinyl transferase superfamily protein [Bacteroidia bacterium]
MGLLLSKQTPDAILGIWEIWETSQQLYSLSKLNEKELVFYRSLQSERRKKHWLSYRLLLPLLAPELQNPSIDYDECGKPYLSDGRYRISVSHSGKYAALILSVNKNVGVDIELMQPKILNLTKKFLSPQELQYDYPLLEKESLYVIWCAKEALYKMHGKRDLSFTQHITVDPFSFDGSGVVTGHIHKEKTTKSYQLFYETINDYMLVFVTGA